MDEHGGLDIENLNKSQIILLTLLVSFVTSIATGIVTVSLMDQAPPAVAQTVNRVVERTVEKVMPAVQTAAVGQTKTIVIKESDLIAQAVEQVRPSVVRVLSSDKEDAVFLGLGLVVTKSGAIAVDSNVLADDEAVVEQSSGQHVRVYLDRRDADTGLAYLVSATSSVEGKPSVWTPASLSNTKLALGQTIFTMFGKSSFRVGDGIISALDHDGDALSLIDTTIPADSIISGSPLVDMDGNVLGISSSVARKTSSSAYIPSSAISPEQKPQPKADPKASEDKKPQ